MLIKAISVLGIGSLAGIGFYMKKLYNETPSLDIFPNTLFYGYNFTRGELDIRECFANSDLTKQINIVHNGKEIVYCPKNSSCCFHGYLFPNQISDELNEKVSAEIKKEMKRKNDKQLKLDKASDIIRDRSFKTRLETMEELEKLSKTSKLNIKKKFLAVSNGNYLYRNSRLKLFGKKI